MDCVLPSDLDNVWAIWIHRLADILFMMYFSHWFAYTSITAVDVLVLHIPGNSLRRYYGGRWAMGDPPLNS